MNHTKLVGSVVYSDVSAEALGILLYLTHLPREDRTAMKVKTRFKLGPTRLYRVLKELDNANLVRKQMLRDKAGMFIKVILLVRTQEGWE